MSHTITSPIHTVKINYTQRTKPYLAGFDKQKNLHFPFYMMGCCGQSEGYIDSYKFEKVRILDKNFFDKVASVLKNFPNYDWDWNSFRNTVIIPNKEHICKYCDITDERIWKRFCEDGYVFLDSWFDKDFDIEDDGSVAELPNANRNSVFTILKCDY